MSAQVLELIFFAVIAFLVISKLIATLGTTDEDENQKYNSFFGEKKIIKDVTGTVKSYANDQNATASKIESDEVLANIALGSDLNEISQNLNKIRHKLPSFDLSKFLHNATKAFKLILSSINDDEKLSSLIDKRFIEKFALISDRYFIKNQFKNINAKISEISSFGNNIFIKVTFSGEDILKNISAFNEEWTFTRNLNVESFEWYLSNIEDNQ